ncbi:SCO family protein [Alkalihalobacillus sp. 1P02AB]|uniref:SCO family protein n=1 Tax=Alkalihalobacillus sp. 1P02AB TaxID=3132260 RepID=UPI0039A47891
MIEKSFRYGIMFFILVALSGCGWLYELGNKADEYDVSQAEMVVSNFEYVNQNGEVVSLEDLKGHYWLADMVFTACPTVCPIMTPNMRDIQDYAIEEDIELKFISFTIDPENDTVDHLKAYTQGMKFNDDYWSFLTGYTIEEITQFAKESFRSPVQKMEDDFVHSTRFFLVNPEGQVIKSYDGMAVDLTDIKRDIQRTVQ